jgi:thymidylate synthase (FAD)
MVSLDNANIEAIQARNNEGADEILGLYFPVLDHGFVALVDYMGNDAAIAQAARCSYGAGTRSISNDRALIRYLARHRHTSPLEQMELKLHCKMPIFVARQWVRHRTASLNEMSGRYSVMPLQFYSPDFGNFKKQSSNNKQGREELINHEFFIENRRRSDTARELIKENYINDLEHDVARELARIDLPLATYTEWYWKMDLHNLMHFLTLRCDSHAQYEIRVYANIIAGMVKRVAPSTYEAWIDYYIGSVNFSRQEMIALRTIFDDAAGCGDCLGGIPDCLPNPEQYKEFGNKFNLTEREVSEFVGKLLNSEMLDFSLDLSLAKPPSYFREQAEKYVPEIKL